MLIPDGEVHKTVETWTDLVRQILAPEFRRGTAVVALGGGVVGDMAGFAAATALRGVPFVQLPTTLLAMVDSSVGGKTAVNLDGKNRLGAFYQPTLVWAATDTLGTLPRGERLSGLGEVMKTALIDSEEMLRRVEVLAPALRGGEPDATAELVAACVRCKARVVAEDELERGNRAWLNAGHTLAHGLERVLGGERIRHGAAVAMGLIAETDWAVRQGTCLDPDLPRRLATLTRSLGLRGAPPPVDRAALVEALYLDKKAGADSVGVPVPVRAGEMTLVDVPLESLHTLVPESP